MERYYCKYCGGLLEKTATGEYKCNFCNNTFSNVEKEKCYKVSVESDHNIALELSPLVRRRFLLKKIVDEYKAKPEINSRAFLELKVEITKLEEFINLLDKKIEEERVKLK